MSSEKIKANEDSTDRKSLYALGGICAIVIGISYIIITALYVLTGAPPSGGEAKLAYFAGKTTAWWAIVLLSVLTDFLFLPVALSLYVLLKKVNRTAMMVGSGFLGLFAVLDLVITWAIPRLSLSATATPQPQAMSKRRPTSRLPTTQMQC
jgi:hypothetical protein